MTHDNPAFLSGNCHRGSQVQPCWDALTASHTSQQHIGPGRTGHQFTQGSQAPCSNAVIQHQPNIPHSNQSAGAHPTVPQISNMKPHQHGTPTGTLPVRTICTINAQGICPHYSGSDHCWKNGWKSRSHHTDRQGLPS